jgi:hypothetical protein
MRAQSFSLIPFRDPTIPDIAVTGNLFRQNNILGIQYALAGNLEEILLPPPSANPARKDELWKAACFEFFLATKDSPHYWEFNLSPSGDWNVYHMDAYRRIGFREELLIQQLACEIHRDTDNFRLRAELDLNPILSISQALDIGITAVIQTKSGNETYWALVHPAPQADFHLRESFILETAG